MATARSWRYVAASPRLGARSGGPGEDRDVDIAEVVVFGLGRVAVRRAPARDAGARRDERGLVDDRDRLGSPAALDRGRGEGADGDGRRADHHGGIHAVDELLPRAVAAVDGEHGGQHGDTEHTAKLAD